MDIKGRIANPTTLIVISMVLGVGAGIVGGSALVEVQFIGDIFFRLIQMCIVPFVMCTIMEAVGGLTARDLSGFGLKGIVWFAVSSILASVFGIVSTLIFQPSAGLAGSALVEGASSATGATSTT